MSQIMYTYPAMLAHAQDMHGYATAIQTIGADIASEQASLASAWQGDTGDSYQSWQRRWNEQLEELVHSYLSMVGQHEQNILAMNARDMAEGAKWA